MTPLFFKNSPNFWVGRAIWAEFRLLWAALLKNVWSHCMAATQKRKAKENLETSKYIANFILIFLVITTRIHCLQNNTHDVVRVRIPFSSLAHYPPLIIYDNTTDTVTGYLKDLLDAVFTSANLSYSLAGINDVAAFRAKGYNYFGRDSRFTT